MAENKSVAGVITRRSRFLLEDVMVVICQMSNEKIPGCLGYIGDENLPSYVGMTINQQHKDHFGGINT